MRIYDGNRVPEADHDPLKQLEFDLSQAIKLMAEAAIFLIEAGAEVIKDLLAGVVGAIVGATVTIDNMIVAASEWASTIPVLGNIWDILAPHVTGVAHAGIEEIRIFFMNLRALLDVVDFMDPEGIDRDATVAAFLDVVLFPLNMVPRLIEGLIPGINIPGLDGSKIVSGLVAQSFLDITSIAGEIILGELSPDNIPGLDAAKIVSGTISRVFLDLEEIAAGSINGLLDPLNIPGLDASKIVSGAFAQIRVVGLPALQTASDTLVAGLEAIDAVVGDLGGQIDDLLDAADYISGEALGDALYQLHLVGGVLSSGVIPGLDASKIVTGLLGQAFIPSLTSGWGGTIYAPAITGSLTNANEVSTAIINQVANVIIALVSNKAGGLTDTTGLAAILNGLVANAGIVSGLGGTPVLASLDSIPQLAPALEVMQEIADGVGIALKGPSDFVQQNITNPLTSAQIQIQTGLQQMLPWVTPLFW
jgi:hypothetical protein